MKIKIDKNKCIGCGSCVYSMQEMFVFDNDGKAKTIKEKINDSNLKELEITKNNCPAKAIKILKE